MADTITAEQALAVLPDGDTIHTFRNPAGMLLGADWSRADVEKAIRETDIVLLMGPMARGMGHGIGINFGGRRLMIQTDPARLDAIDPPTPEKE